ncbi:S41 family peptidase [bacterium]|nr:S41 family peptidase [bacterium]
MKYKILSSGIWNSFFSKKDTCVLCDLIQNNCLDEKVGKRVVDRMRSCFDLGIYNQSSSKEVFSKKVSESLIKFSGDMHFQLNYNPEKIDKSNEERVHLEFCASRNYGFEGLNDLGNNIIHLVVGGFVDPNLGNKSAEKACINELKKLKLKSPKVVIIDLRNNGGGHPKMVYLLASFFLPEFTSLSKIRIKENGNISTSDYRTHSYEEIPIQDRILDARLHILTSSQTFSAAEEFVYLMKHLRDAKVIGEKTKGGAHPCSTHHINDDFSVCVPNGEIIVSKTNGNWEGTGVLPDIECCSTEALKTSLKTL